VVLLAATAGSVDLLALTDMGGAFASIITGNLVTVGFGTGTPDRLVAVAVAVGGFAGGVLIWALFWRRRPGVVLGSLLAELALLGIVAIGLLVRGPLAAGSTETGVRSSSLILLAVAAVAMVGGAGWGSG
jgi:uncharacterized membrane protein YoaK (UPF0700 family)